MCEEEKKTEFSKLPPNSQQMIVEMLNDMEKEDVIERLLDRLSKDDIIAFIAS